MNRFVVVNPRFGLYNLPDRRVRITAEAPNHAPKAATKLATLPRYKLAKRTRSPNTLPIAKPLHATPTLELNPDILDDHTVVLAKGDTEAWLRVTRDADGLASLVEVDELALDSLKALSPTEIDLLMTLAEDDLMRWDLTDEQLATILYLRGRFMTSMFGVHQDNILPDVLERPGHAVYRHENGSHTPLCFAHDSRQSQLELGRPLSFIRPSDKDSWIVKLKGSREIRIVERNGSLWIEGQDFDRDFSMHEKTMFWVGDDTLVLRPDDDHLSSNYQAPLVIKKLPDGRLKIQECSKDDFYNYFYLHTDITPTVGDDDAGDNGDAADVNANAEPSSCVAVQSRDVPIQIQGDRAVLTIDLGAFNLTLSLAGKEIAALEECGEMPVDLDDTTFGQTNPPGDKIHIIEKNSIYVNGFLINILSIIRLDDELIASVEIKPYFIGTAGAKLVKIVERPKTTAPVTLTVAPPKTTPLFSQQGTHPLPTTFSRGLWLMAFATDVDQTHRATLPVGSAAVEFDVRISQGLILPARENAVITVGKTRVTAEIIADEKTPHLFWLTTAEARYPLYHDDSHFYLHSKAHAFDGPADRGWLARQAEHSQKDDRSNRLYFSNAIENIVGRKSSADFHPPELTQNPFDTFKDGWQDMIFPDGEVIGVRATKTATGAWLPTSVRWRAAHDKFFTDTDIPDAQDNFVMVTLGRDNHQLKIFFEDGIIASCTPHIGGFSATVETQERWAKSGKALLDITAKKQATLAVEALFQRQHLGPYLNRDDFGMWPHPGRGMAAFLKARLTPEYFDVTLFLDNHPLTFNVYWNSRRQVYELRNTGLTITLKGIPLGLPIKKSETEPDLYFIQVGKKYFPVVLGKTNLYVGLAVVDTDKIGPTVIALRERAKADNQRWSLHFGNRTLTDDNQLTLHPPQMSMNPSAVSGQSFWQDLTYPDGMVLGAQFDERRRATTLRVKFPWERDFTVSPTKEGGLTNAATDLKRETESLLFGDPNNSDGFGFALVTLDGLLFTLPTTNDAKIEKLGDALMDFISTHPQGFIAGMAPAALALPKPPLQSLLPAGQLIAASSNSVYHAFKLSVEGISPGEDQPPVWPVDVTSADGLVTVSVPIFAIQQSPASQPPQLALVQKVLAIDTPHGTLNASPTGHHGISDDRRYRYSLYDIEGYRQIYVCYNNEGVWLGSTFDDPADHAHYEKMMASATIRFDYTGHVSFPTGVGTMIISPPPQRTELEHPTPPQLTADLRAAWDDLVAATLAEPFAGVTAKDDTDSSMGLSTK